MSQREAWLAVVQDGDDGEETELVTLEGVHGDSGGTIETTDGRRIADNFGAMIGVLGGLRSP